MRCRYDRWEGVDELAASEPKFGVGMEPMRHALLRPISHCEPDGAVVRETQLETASVPWGTVSTSSDLVNSGGSTARESARSRRKP